MGLSFALSKEEWSFGEPRVILYKLAKVRTNMGMVSEQKLNLMYCNLIYRKLKPNEIILQKSLKREMLPVVSYSPTPLNYHLFENSWIVPELFLSDLDLQLIQT